MEAPAAEPGEARAAGLEGELVVAQAAGAEREGALAREPVVAQAAGAERARAARLEREEAEAEESGVTRIFSRRTLQRAPLDRSGTGRSTSAFRDTAACSGDPELTEYAYALAKSERYQEALNVLDTLENPNTSARSIIGVMRRVSSVAPTKGSLIT